ncbi:MAG: chemotaxis protein CheB [Pseudomonadota bacterium]
MADELISSDEKEAQTEEQTAHFWVGLGASAGGLEALRAFARQLPDKLSVTYIVAQHLSPHHRSMLPEIIGRETSLEVLSAEDDVAPLPNKIYITPQNKDIEIRDGRIRIVPSSRDSGTPTPSVDRFLKSLAFDKGENAVGIILSGTGSDGSRGLRDVQAAGGITIAQDEHSAKYTGMPVAAVEAGVVDLVMSPEEIGAQFPTILERRANLSSLKASPVHLDSVSELIHLVHNRCRVNFRHYKAATLQRRIERRMAAIGVSEIEDYVSIARTSDKEIDALFKDFLISVTSFFRDPVEFEMLRSNLKDIIASKDGSDPIRVWIPGCATGEEVYTICMIFADLIGGLQAFVRKKVQFFATDIDQDAIEIARRGVYPETSLEEVPRDFIDEYFEKVPTGYVLKKEIRERIVFSIHNVIQDPPFLNVDFISCRNLLIYFQSSLQSQVLSRFHYSLVPNGILFLGKSETTAANDTLFRASEHGKHLYFQRPTKSRPVFDDYNDLRRAYGPRRQAQDRNADQRDVTSANARFDSLIKAFGPDGFLVSADLQLRKAYGNVDPYVSLTTEGNLSLGVSTFIREPFAQDIRMSVPMAIRKKEVRRGVAHPPTPVTRKRKLELRSIRSKGAPTKKCWRSPSSHRGKTPARTSRKMRCRPPTGSWRATMMSFAVNSISRSPTCNRPQRNSRLQTRNCRH